MSHSSPSHSAAANRTRRGAPSAAVASRHLHHSRTDYTLVHGGRQVHIGPVAFWAVIGALMIMAIWAITTGGYFAFHDDVITRLIGRQAAIQSAYEDRIADLRAQVDRITSRQLLDQEQYERKLATLLLRQAVLQQRTDALGSDLNITGAIRPAANKRPTQLSAEPELKLSPISDTVIPTAPPDRESRLAPYGLHASSNRAAKGNDLDGPLGRVSAALDRIDHRQMVLLSDLEKRLDAKAHRMRGVLSELSVDPLRAPGAGLGGPFVPANPPRSGANAFDREFYRVDVARAEVNQYAHTLRFVPVRKPVAGDIDMSSPFGMRLDPFLGRPAIHTGVDLRGEIGEPVHATATGRVSIAGRDGGYGNMVEINHGNGLATRYGHLSRILVRVGQTVRVGEVIGLIGSTGRSTGPHLHYETRINGEAVDPQKFLRAGVRLGNALQG